jgi:UDPglucose 6-dehydrogenase
MKVTIVGTGYVGLVAGVCFAETGHEVLGLDIDAAKIKRLQEGDPVIYEPGLADLLRRNLREERIRFTTDYAQAARHARVFFLCLPTPPTEDGSADVKYVLAAVRSLSKVLDTKASEPALFVLKSTVPVDTAERIRKEVEACYPGPFAVASNPEFLKEGAAVEDFLKPDRVVVGVTDDRSYDVLRELYDPFCRTGAPILRMTPASASLTKYAANCLLATKISFMNEIARLCDASGADVDEVRKGISLDPRIGKAFLFPGLGYGGSCFPKDTRALSATARALGLKAEICDAVERVNNDQKAVFLPKLIEHLKSAPAGNVVAVWGLSFKPRTDDIREAPALALIERLLKEGVKVQAFDPEAMENVRRQLGDRIVLTSNLYAALDGADALVLATEWNEFRAPDWTRVKQMMKRPAVFDGRNLYDPKKLRAMGFQYWGIGRS